MQSESGFALCLRGNLGNGLNQLLKATNQEAEMTEHFSRSRVQKQTSQEAEYRNLINITTAKARLDLNLQDAEVHSKHSRNSAVSSQLYKLLAMPTYYTDILEILYKENG